MRKKSVVIAPGTDLNADSYQNRIETALKSMAAFRFNTITRFPEIKFEAEPTVWKRLDDYRLHSLVRDLRSQGIKCSKTGLAELLESEFSPKINPIVEYFENLHYEGGDPIAALSSTVTLKDEAFSPSAFRVHLKKWLVGTVANVFITDRCANQLCFILAGPQGVFKSTWIRSLCPPALREYYIEGALDPDNKDSLLATATNFIFNLDDYFAGITSRKINEFKGLITKNTVKVRRPYTRYAEELPKICSFIASSNEAQFLHDSTGNRRFLPFEVQAIAIDQAASIDIDQVWAQAYHQFKSGFTYWLTKEDQSKMEAYNSRFEVQSAEYEILITFLRPPQNGEIPDAALTNTDIQVFLHGKTCLKLSAKKLGEALRKAGFPREQKQRNYRRSWVYHIIYTDEADIHMGRQA